MGREDGYFHIMVAIFIFLIIYLIITFLPQTHSVLNGMKQSETTAVHQAINRADTVISKRLSQLQSQFNKMQGKK